METEKTEAIAYWTLQTSVRWGFSLFLISQVFRETGPFTALFALFTLIAVETLTHIQRLITLNLTSQFRLVRNINKSGRI